MILIYSIIYISESEGALLYPWIDKKKEKKEKLKGPEPEFPAVSAFLLLQSLCLFR